MLKLDTHRLKIATQINHKLIVQLTQLPSKFMKCDSDNCKIPQVRCSSAVNSSNSKLVGPKLIKVDTHRDRIPQVRHSTPEHNLR